MKLKATCFPIVIFLAIFSSIVTVAQQGSEENRQNLFVLNFDNGFRNTHVVVKDSSCKRLCTKGN